MCSFLIYILKKNKKNNIIKTEEVRVVFEWTKGNAFTLYVTLYTTNITLNSAAASYFSDVRWVMIGVDHENALVAIKPVTKRELDLKLVPLEQLHKISIGKGYGRISNKMIMAQIEELCKEKLDGIKRSATFDEKQGMLIVDLHS